MSGGCTNTACVFAAKADDDVDDSSVSAELEQKLNQQYYKSLDGFLIVIAKNGDVVYVSENAEKYLGLTQVYFKLMQKFYLPQKCRPKHDCVIAIIRAVLYAYGSQIASFWGILAYIIN